MSRISYTISWLYGEFRIARFNRSTVEAQWQAPELVNTQAELIQALDTAGEFIDLSAKGDVTVVHEHDLHTHDYLEVPAMSKRDLEKYLLRRVEQDKSFPEAAAWCYHKVKHQGGQQGVLLHLLPKNIVDSTVAACTAVGLAPKRYVPLTEIVSDYLPSTDVDPQSLLVIVACFDLRTELIVALGDGEALFVRELNYGASEEVLERLTTDLNRTVRYTRQQVGRAVDTVWIMGHPPWPVVEGLRNGVTVPVHFDADATDPNFWALWSTRLGNKLSANFISVFAQKNITVDVVRRVGVWTTAAVIALAVILTVFTTGVVSQRSDQMQDITYRAEAVRDSISDLQAELREGESRQEHLARLRATSHNLPSLLMLHLSRLTPAEITLTEVAIEQSANGWQVNLQGLVGADMRTGARVLAHFEERLSAPPWQISMSESFRTTWMEQFEQGRLRSGGQLGFTIAGELR